MTSSLLGPAQPVTFHLGTPQQEKKVVPLTVKIGEQNTQEIDTLGLTFCGFYTPAALTGTALTFLARDDYVAAPKPVKVRLTGEVYSQTIAVDGYYPVDPDMFFGVRYLTLRMGSAQAAAIQLVAVLRPL